MGCHIDPRDGLAADEGQQEAHQQHRHIQRARCIIAMGKPVSHVKAGSMASWFCLMSLRRDWTFSRASGAAWAASSSGFEIVSVISATPSAYFAADDCQRLKHRTSSANQSGKRPVNFNSRITTLVNSD